jgi:hypothetical protein
LNLRNAPIKILQTSQREREKPLSKYHRAYPCPTWVTPDALSPILWSRLRFFLISSEMRKIKGKHTPVSKKIVNSWFPGRTIFILRSSPYNFFLFLEVWLIPLSLL